MNTLKGTAISPGTTIGIVTYINNRTAVTKNHITDPEAEIQRFTSAAGQAIIELTQLTHSTVDKIGKENAALFDVHKMMVEDNDFQDSIISMIHDELVCAEFAIEQTANHLSSIFSQMEDEYMSARAADILDISKRLQKILTNQQGSVITQGFPAIYAATDFYPSETASFDKQNVLALLAECGSQTSHTAIFARAMGIPAIFELGDTLKLIEGRTVIADGTVGMVIIDPDIKIKRQYQLD